MKKTYVMPTATKVDFQFETSVVASNTPIGNKYRPTHPTECQMSQSGESCNYNYSREYGCMVDSPFSLR